MIRWLYAFIDRPRDRFDRAVAFWTAVTGTRLSSRRGRDDEFATLLPDAADACLKMQATGDGGGAHLDLAADDVAALVRHALGAGAGLVANHDEWAVLRSPGGQPFCAVPWHGERQRPAPFADPSGARSRLDQVCVDASADAFDAEVAFWSAVTGWPGQPSARPEFVLVKPPVELPVRILVQRLGSPPAAGAHPDLACSDVDAVRAWHERCGAVEVDRRPLWTVMRDPSGGLYCLTVRDPDTGRLPAWALGTG